MDTSGILHHCFQYRFIVAVCCLLSIFAIPTPAYAQSNLLKNGDFEFAAQELPADWQTAEHTKNFGRFALSSNKKSSGNSSLRLEPNERNIPGPNRFGIFQTLSATALNGKTLTVSASLAGENGAVAVLSVFAIKNGGGETAGVLLRSRGAELTRFSEQLTLPKENPADLILVLCIVEGTTGSVYFDQIELQLAESKPITVSDSAKAELRASVTIDAQHIVRRIPKTLYGTNIEWPHDGSGVWNRRAATLDKELLRLAGEMRISLVRFPGGGFSDHYHWRDGIGPLSLRPKKAPLGTGETLENTFGTDEVSDFAKHIGADLLFTVNAGTGTAEEAAEWVAYTNTKNRLPVRLWEVGNELYMKGDAPQSQAIAVAPEVYAKRYLQFAEKMRVSDPSIRVGAIGGKDWGRIPFISFSNWNEVVLAQAGKQIDFFSIHNGYAPVVIETQTPDARAVYQALLAAPLHIAKNLQELDRDIEKYADDKARRIKVAITEWGPIFQVQPGQPYLDHVKTLGSAIYVASALKTFIESPRVEIATYFKFFDIAFMGWIGRKGETSIAKPAAKAFQMFTSHFGTRLLQTEMKSPGYDSPAIGYVPATTSVPYVDAISSMDESGKILYIMLINKHLDKEITADIALRDFSPRKNGLVWTLTGPSADSHTGTELPAIPGIDWGKQAEVEPRRRMLKGSPTEVEIQKDLIGGIGVHFTSKLPPLSIRVIEITAS